jgi:ATP-binding cassette, subfamily C, bacterial
MEYIMTSSKSKNKFYPIYFFIKAYPKRSVFIVTALLSAGLAEAVSFAAMIPLLGMAILQDTGDRELGFLETGIAQVFKFVGLEMTMGGVLVLIVLLMGLKSFLSFYARKEVGYICADVEVDFRKSMVNSLLYADWSYYLKNQTGDFSTAISTQIQSACNVFRASGLVFAGFLQVGLFSAMSMSISLPITLGGVFLGLTVIFILRNFVTLARVSAKTLAKHEGTLLSTLIDGLRGIKSNKAMGLQGRLQKYLEQDIEKLAVMRKRIVFSSAVLNNFAEPVQVLGIAVALSLLISYWEGGIEELLILILLFYRTGQRLGNLQIYYQQIFTAIPPFWFVTNIISSAQQEREDLKSGDEAFLNDSIIFNKVSFAYDSKNILSSVDLIIKAGDFVTIVGPSGGGKTTLTDMLLRFNNPDTGTIEIDGKNINSFSKSSMRNMIGYVPQETTLFFDSIRNNLTFGNSEITDLQLKDVLRRAGAISFVEQLPEGLDFNVGEHGGRLSGGQKQRLGLARALLNDPKILLLDEPTSSLDKKSENDILNTLNDLRGTVTIIAISHQETFVNASDKKYLLENGELKSQELK